MPLNALIQQNYVTVNQYSMAIRLRFIELSELHSDGWREYNGLVGFRYKTHFRVSHGKNECSRGNAHINGIESF